MKEGDRFKGITRILCVILMTLASGCLGVRVPLSHYEPSLAGDFGNYRGKRLYLMNFENQANDTSIWRYYSEDQKFSYSTNDTLHNYFWYAFRDAFLKSGMLISNVDNPDLLAPAMWVTLLSMTDEKYHVRVTVQEKGITVFTKPYKIHEPALEEKDRNPAVLEQRAYRMTNRLIKIIMEDPEFRKVL